mmetsp:Transcript_137925/g.440446  ORF Transcript_137925/g.440446 Transcript_137925/m.440446 type:complete len:243 (+) Transcript_137925:350-1078(+)
MLLGQMLPGPCWYVLPSFDRDLRSPLGFVLICSRFPWWRARSPLRRRRRRLWRRSPWRRRRRRHPGRRHRCRGRRWRGQRRLWRGRLRRRWLRRGWRLRLLVGARRLVARESTPEVAENATVRAGGWRCRNFGRGSSCNRRWQRRRRGRRHRRRWERCRRWHGHSLLFGPLPAWLLVLSPPALLCRRTRCLGRLRSRRGGGLRGGEGGNGTFPLVVPVVRAGTLRRFAFPPVAPVVRAGALR